MGYEMLHRLIDELAALAMPDHSINGFDRRFRQNNINAFAHGYQDLVQEIRPVQRIPLLRDKPGVPNQAP